MKNIVIAGAAAGAIIGGGLMRTADILPTHSAVNGAEAALQNENDCREGTTHIEVTDVTSHDGAMAQRFTCGRGIVIMTVQGPDWDATHEHSEAVANQNLFLPNNSHESGQTGIGMGFAALFGGLAAGNIAASKRNRATKSLDLRGGHQ